MATGSVSFTADQTLLDLFVTAACKQYNYQTNIPDPANKGKTIPNPQTPGQFAKQCIINYAKSITKNYQIQQAMESARISAVAAAASQIDSAIITAI